MNEHVLVTDPLLIDAVQNGNVIGEIYSDGECYVELESTFRWLDEQPVAVLEAPK